MKKHILLFVLSSVVFSAFSEVSVVKNTTSSVQQVTAEGVDFETDFLSDKDQEYVAADDTLLDAAIVQQPELAQAYPMSGPKEFLAFNVGNVDGKIQFKFKPEVFFGKNANLLNNNVDADRTMWMKSTLDVNCDVVYGRKLFKHDVMEFFMTLRNKVTWGNIDSIAQTADSEIKLTDAVLGAHSHAFTRQVPWIREAWLKVNINDALRLPFCHQHYFTLGAFPFELGRGIALGSAYAVGPGVLGFYSDNKIDQYAYGFKISGEMISKILSYDVYTAILENRGDSFANTSLRIAGQEYGKKLDPARGPGRVNYLAAAKMKWIPASGKDLLFSLEPYGLYNNAPEQRIEFLADAKTKLATFGLAGEFMFGNIEWGFDTAFNIGTQHVRGWDRNKIDAENRGSLTFVNTEVIAVSTPVIAVANYYPPNKKMVHEVFTSAGQSVAQAINNVQETQIQNGQQFTVQVIDPTDPTGMTTQIWTLRNGKDRFVDPYHNYLRGKMAVMDAAYWIYKRDLKVAMTAGIATGDENPNRDIRRGESRGVNGDYDGFIPLQEIYTGQRVQSVFLLGGAGRLPRPLSTPHSGVLDPTPSVVSGFTNLIFTGASLYWQPKCFTVHFKLFPNILFYWQDTRIHKFDRITKKENPTEFASSFLGTELNAFFDVELIKDFKLFAIGSVFIPGGHYRDIKGKPLNREQIKILDRLDVTGVNNETVPLLGDDIAYTINVGLEARF